MWNKKQPCERDNAAVEKLLVAHSHSQFRLKDHVYESDGGNFHDEVVFMEC